MNCIASTTSSYKDAKEARFYFGISSVLLWNCLGFCLFVCLVLLAWHTVLPCIYDWLGSHRDTPASGAGIKGMHTIANSIR